MVVMAASPRAVDTRHFPPIPAVQEVATEASPGYGRWAATGDREIRLTFYAIIWKEGHGNGYQRVQETLAMSEPGDEYTGQAQVDFLDANWNVVISTTSDVKGTRLETPATLMAQPAEKKQLVGRLQSEVPPRPVLIPVKPQDEPILGKVL
jgi:hypothetical protein